MTEPVAQKPKMDSMVAWGVVGATLVAGYFVGIPAIGSILVPAIKAPFMAIAAAFTFGGSGLAAASIFTGDKDKTFGGRMAQNLGRVSRGIGYVCRKVGEAYSVAGSDLASLARVTDRWAEKKEAKQVEAKAAPAVAVEPESTLGKRKLFGMFRKNAVRAEETPVATAEAAPAAKAPGAAA